jgi:2-amino-4-hydroxy-6-hydroxymethyldihydropteridine diphosphokinase
MSPSPEKSSIVYLLLGGNLGDVKATFEKALRMISHTAGNIILQSRIYKSPAWGFDSGDLFLNQVLTIQTQLKPYELLGCLLDTETALGRVRGLQQMDSREIDIDILFYDQEVTDQPELQIPHPRLHLRRFTLVPLAEIAPELIHPVFKKSIKHLLQVCTDKSLVIPAEEN